LPKQLLLYMSREDENEFLSYLRSSGDIVILPATSSTSEFASLYTLPEASQDEATRKFWLQNTAINLPLVTEFLEQSGYYVIDGFQSPVVEFLRSFTVARMMLPGRLQADMTYFDGDKQDLVSKPVAFRRWFDSIEDWVRKRYKHLTLLTYTGPGAEKFRSEGGLLH
jgi:hypothetical protein